MSIPNDKIIQDELLKLLYNSEEKMLHCKSVYDSLAKLFPELTVEEKTKKYRESLNKWANRVQFARLHLVNNGLLLNAKETKKFGYWKISLSGEEDIRSRHINMDTSDKTLNEINILINTYEDSPIVQDLFNPNSIIDAREKTICSIVQRRGQTVFREDLIKAYDRKCALTRCNVLEILEASHIIPYKGSETNNIQNGILLRADIHTLFDLRLLTINESNYKVIISEKLKGTEYEQYENVEIKLPIDEIKRPNKEALKKHRLESNL